MIAIVLKDSTYTRVTTRLRRSGDLVTFISLPTRVFHDGGFTYLHFYFPCDFRTATEFLSAYHAVYRVFETT